MEIRRILETCINVDEIARARAWYQAVFGFEVMASDDRFCAFNIGHQDVLLLFRRGSSKEPFVFAGGSIPPHDTSGGTHLAFGIHEEELGDWRKRLKVWNIALESEVRWERGGTSVYFRDPDQNLLELATHGIWPIY